MATKAAKKADAEGKNDPEPPGSPEEVAEMKAMPMKKKGKPSWLDSFRKGMAMPSGKGK